MSQSVPPPSAAPAAHAIPTEPCDACGQLVELRAAACPRCGFPRRTRAQRAQGSGSKSARSAMWLSLAWPGAGHLYGGDSEKGLILVVGAAVLTVLSLTVLGLAVGMIAWLGLALYAAIDSGRALG